MNPLGRLLSSSLGKKYLMAISGFIFVGFVLGHMVGNLQLFGPPAQLNTYAHFLKSLGPALWGIRAFLLLMLVIHVVTAILLVIENKKARPAGYKDERPVQASFASRTMKYTGIILLAFILFHLAHYTLMWVYDYHALKAPIMWGGKEIMVLDVYTMMYVGFSHVLVSAFYILSMGLLCLHLAHGVSSMFQSFGWRNERWRKILGVVAVAYGWIIFLGFISMPVAVLADHYGLVTIFDAAHIENTLNNAEHLALK